uniref:Reverse transcriptase Ty1/copia-type domain-containing protein n=1 Tax=Chromera velia CCMP2878 TaxID=1169474 RepID=A0A0G4HI11_9ALVE|eukprot:Cvel_27680.t1-p1 / transcript=Cvel_27680.t1 / gene=Cvel_27680 / organism=Chromera_velia_CCMP2878 / gene_product=hypothetical protein / transcript_product=hypothetical protein / location=Cvel_scaffold3492:2676-5942(-) / protein_length=199 / sequence_SO=supercontig / SO=protein_coding / is_pseudo=false
MAAAESFAWDHPKEIVEQFLIKSEKLDPTSSFTTPSSAPKLGSLIMSQAPSPSPSEILQSHEHGAAAAAGSSHYSSNRSITNRPWCITCSKEGVSVSSDPASHWAMRVAFSIAFGHDEFDPTTSVLVGDIENAYLNAPRPDGEAPVYVIPPADHPNHGNSLWLLKKCIYGLRDSGHIFEGDRDRALMSAGWVKSGVQEL